MIYRKISYMKRCTGKISLTITLLWVMVIFSFSLQPANASSQLSLGVGHWLIELLPSAISDKLLSMPQTQLELFHTLLRKAGHFSEYFILGMLSMLTVLQSEFCHKKWIGLGFSLLVASVDETIQLFVSGRSGQVSDVVLDFVGALCGIVLLLIIIKVFGKEGSRF